MSTGSAFAFLLGMNARTSSITLFFSFRFRRTLIKYQLESKHEIYAIILDATGNSPDSLAKRNMPLLYPFTCAGINSLDSTSIHLLEDLVQEYQAKRIRFLWANVKGSVRATMKASGNVRATIAWPPHPQQ